MWSHARVVDRAPGGREGWGHSSNHRGEHMYSDSMLYTIGTALNRAHDNGVASRSSSRASGSRGRVAAVDGHGVVLHSDDAEHSVIRMGSVSAVRVFSTAPMRASINAGPPVPRQNGYGHEG